MEYINWKEFLIPYTYAVEELKVKFKNIRNELRDGSQYSPIEFVTGRVKKISSIIDKANRLNIKINEESLKEGIEDIAGIRIMCQFVEDIYKVIEYISNRNDMTIMYQKDYIKNVKESGYRSYHVIIKYPFQTVAGEENILVEIQLRTLAMNFWATIEHSLKYKYNHNLPSNLSERLRISADAAFKLDEEMGFIKEEIIHSQGLFEKKSSLVEEIFVLFQALLDIGYEDKVNDYVYIFKKCNQENDLKGLEMLKTVLYNEIESEK